MRSNSKLFLLNIFVIFLSSCLSSWAKPTGPVDEALSEFDRLLVGSLDYAKACFQADEPRQIGGFHWAPSAKTNPAAMPAYIEATDWGRRVLNLAGDPWPISFKAKVVEFIRAKQDPDGFFRHGVDCIDSDPRLLGRNLSVAKRVFSALDVEPSYPFPSSQEETVYPELESTETFLVWLKGLDWTKPWGSGDWVQARRVVIDGMDPEKRETLLNTLWRFYESIQSADTGLWGENPDLIDGNTISGGMKISSTYRAFDRPIPYADRLFQTSLDYLLDPGNNDNILWIRNPVNTLVNLKDQMPVDRMDEATIVAVIQTVTQKFRKFSNPNGSFSRVPGRSLKGPSQEGGKGPCPLSLGLPAEGSMNSVGSGPEAIRKMLYDLAGHEPRGLGSGDVFSDWDGERFTSVSTQF